MRPSWPRDGVPANPRAWLVTAGRFKAIDRIRRRAGFDATLTELAEELGGDTDANEAYENEAVEDDELRLIFICCHPALAPEAKVALTLREMCSLTTEEVARAFPTRFHRPQSCRSGWTACCRSSIWYSTKAIPHPRAKR